MKSSVPAGLRLAFLAAPQHRPALPLHAQWASVRFFDPSRGWSLAAAEATLFRPDLTFIVFDDSFDPAAVKDIPGTRVGMVVRPPHGAAGPWPLASWRESIALTTWYEPPPKGEPEPFAIIPLPVDRNDLAPPDFKQRRIVVPRWAAPSTEILERLAKMEELVVLEPQGRVDDQLKILDTSGVFVTTTYDATGRLDPLPLHAMGRGLLVITTTAFAPLWGFEPEDDYLIRPEHSILAAVDEFLRIPDTSRAVRLRAFQKVAEFFDADEVFQRLTVDALISIDAARLAPQGGARLRSVK